MVKKHVKQFRFPNQHVDWDEAVTVEKLKHLWAEGLSFRMIALQIPGATRSSIAGKVYRLGLRSRPLAREEPQERVA